MTSLPPPDQRVDHPPSPGAEPQVAWGRNLPTALLGFPELQRPEWTPGQLGLGTGAWPDTRPDEESAKKEKADKKKDRIYHTRRSTDGGVQQASLAFQCPLGAKPGGQKRCQKWGTLCVCVGALTARCVTASDAECDVGVTRRLWEPKTSPTEPDDSTSS